MGAQVDSMVLSGQRRADLCQETTPKTNGDGEYDRQGTKRVRKSETKIMNNDRIRSGRLIAKIL